MIRWMLHAGGFKFVLFDPHNNYVATRYVDTWWQGWRVCCRLLQQRGGR